VLIRGYFSLCSLRPLWQICLSSFIIRRWTFDIHNLSASGGLIYSQSQEVQKKCSKTVNFLQFLLKTRSFLQKNAKKCKFLLIFTLIFSSKTNKSYKITLFATANHPNFKNFSQKPPISQLFSFFAPVFFFCFSVFCRLFSLVLRPTHPNPALLTMNNELLTTNTLH